MWTIIAKLRHREMSASNADHVRLVMALVAVVSLAGCGLCLTCCAEHTNGAVVGESDSANQFYVKQLKVQNTGLFENLGLAFCAFDIQSPRDTVCYIWLETYEKGELVRDLSFGVFVTSAPGKTLRKKFYWCEYHQPTPPPKKNGKIQWSIGVDEVGQSQKWIDDPFADFNAVAKGGQEIDHIEPGKTYLLWCKKASHGKILGEPKMNEIAVLVKCRIEAAAPDPGRLAEEAGDFSASAFGQYPPFFGN